MVTSLKQCRSWTAEIKFKIGKILIYDVIRTLALSIHSFPEKIINNWKPIIKQDSIWYLPGSISSFVIEWYIWIEEGKYNEIVAHSKQKLSSKA